MPEIPARRVVLITGHVPHSKRKAGFHWLADAYRRLGWHVTFLTVGFSQLSRLKREHRFALSKEMERNRPLLLERDLTSYVWFTPFHPLNRLPPGANWLFGPMFQLFGRLPMPGAQSLVEGADLLIFESNSGVMLVDRIRAWNPTARLVYRVSDDLRLLRAHPVVQKTEKRVLHRFDLISVPSEFLLRKFDGLSNVRLQHHGIETAAFDRPTANPYTPGREANAVFVGTAYFDSGFLALASRSFPGWDFHIIGPVGPLPTGANVIAHGEVPFDDTIPYLQHADVGLSPLLYRPGAESLTDNLKVVQYTYCRLPIIWPDFLRSDRPNAFSYAPGDPVSIRAALTSARAFDRSTIDRSEIGSWDDLARKLAGDVPS